MLGKYLGMGNNVVWSYGYSDNPGAGAYKTFLCTKHICAAGSRK